MFPAQIRQPSVCINFGAFLASLQWYVVPMHLKVGHLFVVPRVFCMALSFGENKKKEN